MMHRFILFSYLFLGTTCVINSQRTVDLIFGDGFIEDTCTVLVYHGSEFYVEPDTILDNEILNTTSGKGLDFVLMDVSIPYYKKSGSTLIRIKVNDKIFGDYRFDSLHRKAEVLVNFERNNMTRLLEVTDYDILSDMDREIVKEMKETYKPSLNTNQNEYLSFFTKRKGRFTFR